MALVVDILSIFPEMFPAVFAASIVGRAMERGQLAVHLSDPREHAPGKHRSTDDTPYGGGSGMVMRPEPVVLTLEAIEAQRGRGRRLLLTPSGQPFTQAVAHRLAGEPHLVLICGRYEGFDERIVAQVDEELSLGDFVLTGGEVAAMAVVEAVVRLCPGVLQNDESTTEESFEQGLLEYPHYTRPQVFRDSAVPEVLLSGNHERIRRWRRKMSIGRTKERRPDLFARFLAGPLSKEDRALLHEIDIEGPENEAAAGPTEKGPAS
jgi:tRNA (guanine37-N1)-methyltransferase